MKKYVFAILICALSFAEKTPPKAMIFGITGQDGAYLAELLLEKGYQVHGIYRRISNFNTKRIDHLYQNPQAKHRRLILHYGDLTDAIRTFELIQAIAPDEIYNLGGQAHVQTSFEMPAYTCEVNGMGTLRILEAIRCLSKTKPVKFYHASTNHIFGDIQELPQTENTPSSPISPYGISKQMAHNLTITYREAYGIFACNGILFNHESPLRSGTFVSKKITRAVANIKQNKQETLFLGSLDAMRDWGYAKDYVESMWLALQQEKPRDYVIASGESHSVREFVEMAFKEVGIQIEWRGTGLSEKGINKADGKVIVAIDPRYLRPTDITNAVGDASMAQKTLGWRSKTSFHDLVKIMVQADLNEHLASP